MAKVSVLMPTYNYAHYIEDAIQSVLGQTFTDFELIIVDNCSTDDTPVIVTKYLSDQRVRYYKNETNIGPIGNFNKVLELGQGEYIKFLFSDDILLPTALEQFIKILDDHPNVSLATSSFEYFGSMSYRHDPPYTGLISGVDAIKSSLLKSNWIGSPSNVIFRRKNYDSKGFDKKWMWWGDLELWHRILKASDLYVLPLVLSKFRYHETSATKDCYDKFENFHDPYYYLKYIRDNNLYPALVKDKEFQLMLKDNARRWIDLYPIFYKQRKFNLLYKSAVAVFEERLVKEYSFSLLRKVKRKLLK
jgi:glycosyltransferase involved in cell wall biosynthesis